MITAQGVTLQFGKRRLFEDVNISFNPGNCYGIIGANGSGKTTFLKILSGEIESTAGEIIVGKGKRLSILSQDQFAFDEYPVLMTVVMGHKRLYDCMLEKDEIYAKAEFSEADGVRASELESEFAEMNGWDAESEAARLLSSLGVKEESHGVLMKQLEANQKVRVLLAQAIFGNPDILLLDEPTNQLDVETIMWLEEFLYEFENTAIVVSHDRHFLDKVCTHTADIDYGKIQIYTGNYSFWKESSELVQRQITEKNKKKVEKRKELESFIARFSANASKSRQATSRKKLLEKLNLDDIKPSSRKYPFIEFKPEREAGNDLLEIKHLSKQLEGQTLFAELNIHVSKGDKIAFLGRLDRSKTILFQILANELIPDQGEFKWGITTKFSYFPKDINRFFEGDLNLIDWLRQFSSSREENFIRGFLGRMLFSGEETQKKVNVLSGGEKVRCMFARMMLADANVLMMDEPTNHLDLESISSLNASLERFPGTILFSSQDHQFVQTVANRIIEIAPNGVIDKSDTTLDEYLNDKRVKEQRFSLYEEICKSAS